MLLKKKPCVIAGLVTALGIGIALNGPIVANAQEMAKIISFDTTAADAADASRLEAELAVESSLSGSDSGSVANETKSEAEAASSQSNDNNDSVGGADSGSLVDAADKDTSSASSDGDDAGISGANGIAGKSDAAVVPDQDSNDSIISGDKAINPVSNGAAGGTTDGYKIVTSNDDTDEGIKPTSAGWYLDELTGTYYWSEDGLAFCKNRWGYINGNWYWFDKTGAMATGVVSVGDQSYHFRENGGFQGAMYTDWSQDVSDNSWYYSNNSGFLLNQWQYIGGVWYWFDTDTFKMKTGWLNLGTEVNPTPTYYFTDSGAMATGWIAQGSDWYYADASGAMASGWRNVGGSWYYMDSATNGYKMKTGWLDLASTKYYLKDTGAMATGWVAQGSDWFWADGSGALAKGWRHINGAWYYLSNEDYIMLRGLQSIGDTRYFFSNDSGAMAENGWGLDNDGSWYWGTSSGALAKGWVNVDGTWYYMDAQSNKMITGYVKNIGGTSYFFNASGAMAQNGWGLASDGSWYWAGSSGALASGWIVVDGSWYYLEPESNKMVINDWRVYSDGKYYFLGGSGAMATSSLVRCSDGIFYLDGSGLSSESGWKSIDGKWYFFDNIVDSKGRHAAKIGFIRDDNNIYCMGSDGAMVSDQWAVYDGSLDHKEAKDFLVYAQSDGVISLKVYADVQDTLYRWNDETNKYEIMFNDGKDHEFDDMGPTYCVDKNGQLVFGWYEFTSAGKSGTKYYSRSGLKKGLFTLDDAADGKIYYADGDGYIVTNNPGKVTYKGSVYYIDSQSVVQTGWKKLSGVRGFDDGYHYFGTDGAMRTNWLLLDSNWYWLQNNGVMVSNVWAQVSGQWYWLQSDGVMKIGWLETNDSRWFFLGCGRDGHRLAQPGWDLVFPFPVG